MKIIIAADHRGFAHKEYIKKQLDSSIDWLDVGAFDQQRSDYPIFAHKAVHEMQNGSAQLGILICGSGIGMAIVANRYPSIYAGLVWNEELAKLAREHDNVNMLVLASDFTSYDESLGIIRTWLAASFLGDRYAKRLAMIDISENSKTRSP